MASEVIKLNLIPKGEMPVFHASQFDTGRLITCELYRGEDAYSVPEGYTVELHCRKVDNNIVTMASTLISNNVVIFTSTEQLTACNGKNLCEVVILDDGYRIGTSNFILEVEIDPLKGGINSTSEIHNLETQVEEITTEIVGENYYNKTEVDTLLSDKADADTVYTKTETDTKLALKANAADVYTKAQTDSLLSSKADSDSVYTKGQTDSLLSSKADSDSVYTKGQTDTLLADKASITYVDGEVSAIDALLIQMQTDIDRKADASDVYTKAQVDSALALKANAADVYTKEETDAKIEEAIEYILPVDTAGPSAIASFTTGLALPLVNCEVGILATGGNGTPDSPNPINGYTEANITANGNTYTIAFGQTVYGGVLDVTRGKLHVTRKDVDLGSLNWQKDTSGDNWGFYINNSEIDNDFIVTSVNEKAHFITEIYEVVTANGNTSYTNNYVIFQKTNGQIFIVNRDYSDNASFKTAMYGKKLVYELAAPFDIDLTPEVISAVVGTNNVYSDTNGDTTVKFKDTIQNYIDKKVIT